MQSFIVMGGKKISEEQLFEMSIRALYSRRRTALKFMPTKYMLFQLFNLGLIL